MLNFKFIIRDFKVLSSAFNLLFIYILLELISTTIECFSKFFFFVIIINFDNVVVIIINYVLDLGINFFFKFPGNNLNTLDGMPVYDIPRTDIFFEIIEPKELAYTYKIHPAQDFGTTFNETFSVKNVPLVPTDPPHACDKILNSAKLYKNVALVERG